MSDLFLSYCRQDCPTATGRLADRLHAEFGAEHVFLNASDIVPRTDFVETLERALASATVVLVLEAPFAAVLRSLVSEELSRCLAQPDREPTARRG